MLTKPLAELYTCLVNLLTTFAFFMNFSVASEVKKPFMPNYPSISRHSYNYGFSHAYAGRCLHQARRAQCRTGRYSNLLTEAVRQAGHYTCIELVTHCTIVVTQLAQKETDKMI